MSDASHIPPDLVDKIRAGKAVLFFGAGASFGASHPEKRIIPLGDALKRLIALKFLDATYADFDFKSICDFAASASSTLELQGYIHSILKDYSAGEHHDLIAKFGWAGLCGTNYDLVIESAYDSSKNPLQRLVVSRSDGDRAVEGLGSDGLLYVKLHGCLTEYTRIKPPLIATTEQIIDHKEGRAGQFAQFMEWARSSTLIFVGSTIGDSNLRVLINEIIKDGDGRPRHYIVRPNIRPREEEYWRDRRFICVAQDFSTFLHTLDAQISSPTRLLSTVRAATESTSFTRFISTSSKLESSQLRSYLEGQCEHVSNTLEASGCDPKRFYRGFDLGWQPIAANLDVRRRVTRAILEERIIPATTLGTTEFVLLKAPAGAGKSIALRRAAWEAARTHDRLVFRVERGGALDVERFEEIVSLTNQRIFVFVDDVTENVTSTVHFIRESKRKRWPISIVGGARYNEWNMRCEDLEPLVDDEYDLKYLSENEIKELLTLLKDNECLGHLASLTLEERIKKLKEFYGRQLLVALHEATENATFRDIIFNEYEDITPDEARLLYLDICSLNRFGPPVRAGLIARVHGIDFAAFQDKFFKPLEQVVDFERDPKSRDWAYKARHPVIAELVYQTALPTVQEKFDSLMRLMVKLNPSYSSDREVLFELIRASSLVTIFRDRVMGSAIYESAVATIGREWGILHQWGIYEMRLGGDTSSLDRAQKLLEEAEDLAAPRSAAVQHSLAELALKRASVATDSIERDGWLRQSEGRAAGLARSASSGSHPQHTLAKIAIARVKDATEAIETSGEELSSEVFSAAVKRAEDVLREGLRRFPNDDRLLTEEAQLGEILKNADRAMKALEKAFRTNPRSELISRRLARIYKAKGLYSDAIATLRATLDLNPGSQILHYDLSQSIMASAPDADQTENDSLIYHLQRSFQSGDRNYEAQFWYARQLCLAGRPKDAAPIFERLKSISVPIRSKMGERGVVMNSDGSSKIYAGQVYNIRQDFAFIRSEDSGLEIFARSNQFMIPFENLKLGSRVHYNLGFTLRGPQAFGITAG